jgi:hypothetical protein
MFGLIEAAQLRLGSSVLGEGIPVGVALLRVMPYWLLVACVMPLVLVIGRRFRFWRRLLKPNVPALAATATGFAFLALAGRAMVATTDERGGVAVRPTPLQLFQAYFPLDLLTYTAFVGTVYAFHYYHEARRRELTASRLEASLAEARLRGLEAQVDPDLLFSTLNDVSALASRGQQKPVVEILERLSELLRAALSDERPEEIPLARELELLAGYVNASEYASIRQLTVDREIAPDVLRALVPRMILPPLVESAAAHGKLTEHEDRRVTIRAAERNELLRLELLDSARWSAEADAPGAQDYRLASLSQRLKRLYGPAQSIEIRNSDDGGSSAVITIPFRRALAGEARLAP